MSLQVLGNEKFVIGKILEGGMGTVYQLVPVRPVGVPPIALKTFQESADRPQFIREAEVWISLGTHPYIAHAIAYTEWCSRPSVISDWYEKSLAETKITSWTTTKIITFALQLIDGLAHAVNSGRVIHQDIKPSNVLVAADNTPRLTDFGMARFAPERLTGVRSMDDLEPNMMCRSVNLGPIGGTPFYMAPEVLFLGASPSVSTDIFSLGVTLYETLTQQHPFLGEETGRHFHPMFRTIPLRHFAAQRGSEIQPLIHLIVAALELDPESRPKSYEGLLSKAGLRAFASSSRPGNIVADVIAQAGFFRAQGRHKQAAMLLRNALQERPSNPVLLNSYAILLLAEGQTYEARETLRMAVEGLRFTSGRHDHALYIDPLANLAGQMISANEFAQANELLSTAWNWSSAQSSGITLFDYQEFGWWYLYNGKIKEAIHHLLATYKAKAPDETSLWWLTLAAWLSGSFRDYAKDLGKFYLNLPNMTAPTAVYACVVAGSTASAMAKELASVAHRKHEAELSQIARDLGLNPPTFRLPLLVEVCKTVMRSLDGRVTGGKYYGDIG